MTNIAKVLDEANKEDIQLLKKHWLSSRLCEKE